MLKKTWQQNLPFIIFILALLLGFLGVSLVNQGMGGDSFVYSSIALNMAHGVGSFGRQYTKTVFPIFYEHPIECVAMLVKDLRPPWCKSTPIARQLISRDRPRHAQLRYLG